MQRCGRVLHATVSSRSGSLHRTVTGAREHPAAQGPRDELKINGQMNAASRGGPLVFLWVSAKSQKKEEREKKKGKRHLGARAFQCNSAET